MSELNYLLSSALRKNSLSIQFIGFHYRKEEKLEKQKHPFCPTNEKSINPSSKRTKSEGIPKVALSGAPTDFNTLHTYYKYPIYQNNEKERKPTGSKMR